MEELYEKYANLLLERCLSMKKGQPLYIQCTIDDMELVRAITRKACSMGVVDIHYDIRDLHIGHELLKGLTVDEIKESQYWNGRKFDEYAEKRGAFLMLDTEIPGLMDDIPAEKIATASMVSRTTKPIYKKLQATYEIPWCIAGVGNAEAASVIFKNESDPLKKHWETIAKICLLDQEDPILAWEQKVEKSEERCKKLNDLKFKTLHYTNSKGTDLYIELTENTIWLGAGEKGADGRKLLVNMPTEEVFTSPNRVGTNGIVYSSKPLLYGGSYIDDFSIRFENGKAVEVKAEQGEAVLKEIIASDENACYLGECALVDYNSPISESGYIFYNTLFDENASCHLAVGTGFNNCTLNGEKMNKEQLLEAGVNQSNTHVDFMIGTKDLNIIGTTFDGKEITIFKDGNFAIE